MISSILGIIFGAIMALVGAFLYGSKKGRDQLENDTNKKVIKEAYNAKKTSDDVNSLSNDDVRDKLREFTRD